MYLSNFSNILNNEGIRTQINNKDIYEIVGQGENYYKLQYLDNKYYYCFVKRERQTSPENIVLAEFDDEISALKYFMINELSRYYFNKAQTIVSDNINVFIETDTIKEEDIKNILLLNNIPNNYLSFINNINQDSILLEKLHDGWFTYYLDDNMKKAFGSKVACSMLEGYIRALRECIMLFYFYNFVSKYKLDIEFTIRDKATYLKYDYN